ncbi:uncharacterized protein LOC129659367 isoform X23 [Bubalus kerabau]|nr:uncharacterized protein LOC129659367 isoform X23 [Bubalus carabanensis]
MPGESSNHVLMMLMQLVVRNLRTPPNNWHKEALALGSKAFTLRELTILKIRAEEIISALCASLRRGRRVQMDLQNGSHYPMLVA